MRTTKRNYLILLMALIHIQTGSSQNAANTSAAVIKIGSQTWMANNLDTDRFSNGDLIPEAKTAEEWKSANKNGKPAWCYYKFNSYYGTKLGKLYNSYTLQDPRVLAPRGYHIPTRGEWNKLIDYYGGEQQAAKKMKGGYGWDDNKGSEGNFNAAAGFFATSDGNFEFDWSGLEDIALEELESYTQYGTWWLIPGTTGSENVFQIREPAGESSSASFTKFENGSGHSIRCIKD